MPAPEAIVNHTLERLRAFVAFEAPDPRAHRSLHADVTNFIRPLLDGDQVGDPLSGWGAVNSALWINRPR